MLDKAGTFKALAQITNTHKRESVLVVTVGIVDGTAWLTAMRTPNPPQCPSRPSPKRGPARLGLFANQLLEARTQPFYFR
jgi:hypothetical protein